MSFYPEEHGGGYETGISRSTLHKAVWGVRRAGNSCPEDPYAFVPDWWNPVMVVRTNQWKPPKGFRYGVVRQRGCARLVFTGGKCPWDPYWTCNLHPFGCWPL